MLPQKFVHLVAAAALLISAGTHLPAQTPIAAQLIELPDHTGSVTWTGTGSGGGRFRIHYQFRGFYILPARPLSDFVKLGATPPSGLTDLYKIIPIETTVSADWSLTTTTSFENPTQERTDCWETRQTGSYSRIIRQPDKAQYALMAEGRLPWPPGQAAGPMIHVEDTRPSGGGVRLQAMLLSSVLLGPDDASPYGTTTFTDYNAPGDVDETLSGATQFGHSLSLGSRRPAYQLVSSFSKNTGGGVLNVSWDSTAMPPVTSEFSLENFSFAGRLEERMPVGRACSYLPDDEKGGFEYAVSYEFGLKRKVDLTLEPIDPNEAQWKPQHGDVREFRLAIKDLEPSEISRIRFSLRDTSAHEGVATNMRNHALASAECPDCRAGIHSQSYGVPRTFHGIPVTHRYSQLNVCPIDRLPDLFFRDADNPGFVVDGATDEGLQYQRGQRLILDRPTETEYVVRVAVRDSAASARLEAEVEVGGVWLRAVPQGATAEETREALMLPLDHDRDGILDRWAADYGVTTAREDNDAMPGPAHRGDGLSAFEEYRGVYEEGKFQRLDPTRKNVFVHDPSWQHFRELQEMRSFYFTQGLDVVLLSQYEFLDDVVNYQSSASKLGDQYMVVVTQNPARPSDVGWRAFANDWMTFAGMASHVGPPTRDANMIAIQNRYATRLGYMPAHILFAHEVGHLMSVAHHGDVDDYVTVAETSDGIAAGRHLVAMRGGQHSGHEQCPMRYNAATLFTRLARLLPYNSLTYDPYPSAPVGAYALCAARTGTGSNAAGAWAGDATRGDCRSQVRVRSF